MSNTRSKGQSLVETSLILSAFVGLLWGMLAIGQSVFVRESVSTRLHDAARWGALNRYDPAVIRNLVLFGTTSPQPDAPPFLGLAASQIVVENPGCPGSNCRVSVAIPAQNIRSVEPVEYLESSTGAAPSKP